MRLHEKGARFPLKLMSLLVSMEGMHAGEEANQSKSSPSLDQVRVAVQF